MPVYNGEQFIRDALGSLLAQSYPDFELIISDNASTDRTEQICREYASHDARIRYVRQSANIGAAANFQFVLNEAVGEYFMWAAHDDYWKPNFIAQALAVMKDKSIGFVFPATVLKSIYLGIYKKIPKDIFKGFEDNDRNRRILSFANLHQSSHKGNLVYSVFRVVVLRNAIAIQGMAQSEFPLCMALLGQARGVIMDEYNFYKRYRYRWPGFRKKLSIRPEKKLYFEKIRDEDAEKTKSMFPELSETLERIRLNHEPGNYHAGYEIIENLLAETRIR